MEANYVGPGWYWVEGVEHPLYCYQEKGTQDVWGRTVDKSWKLGVARYMGSASDVVGITHIPRPITRPVVDWSVMPAWAKWVAQGCTGWFWFTGKPAQHDTAGCYCNEEESGSEFGFIPDEHAPTYTGDWKNSLVGRPE